MSDRFGGDAQKQAKGFYDVVSAGVQGFENQLRVLNVTNKVAIGGITDTATATDLLVGTLNAYAGQGETAESVADILFTTVRQGKTTMQELASSMGNVVATASNTGVRLNELGAAIATLTAGGLKTTKAMTAIKGAVAGLSRPTLEGQQLIEQLGLDFSITALQSKGFAQVMREIREATQGNTAALIKLFPAQEAQDAILPLLGGRWESFNQQLEAFNDTSGATDAAFKRITETASFQIDRLSSGFKNLFTRVVALIDEDVSKYFLELNKVFLDSGFLQSLVATGFKLINFAIATSIQAVIAFRIAWLNVLQIVAKVFSFFNDDFKLVVEDLEKEMTNHANSINNVEDAYEEANRKINEFRDSIGNTKNSLKETTAAQNKLNQALMNSNNAAAGGVAADVKRVESKRKLFDILSQTAGFSAKITRDEITDTKGRNEAEIKLIKDKNERTKAENELDKSRVAAQKQASGEIGALVKSAFGEFKAFQVAEATVATYSAANKALAAYPPPFSYAAAAAAIAFGLANVAKITGLAFQQGGIVPGNQFEGDRVLARVNSGELILNRGQQENLFNAINSGNLGGSGTATNVTVNVSSITGDIPQRSLDRMIDQIRDRVVYGNKRFV